MLRVLDFSMFNQVITNKAGGLRSLLQTEKQIPHRLYDGDAVRAVARADGVSARRPASTRQIAILLQGVTAGVRPGDDDAVAGMGYAQVGHARRLHHGDETPETARDGIVSARH